MMSTYTYIYIYAYIYIYTYTYVVIIRDHVRPLGSEPSRVCGGQDPTLDLSKGRHATSWSPACYWVAVQELESSYHNL